MLYVQSTTTPFYWLIGSVSGLTSDLEFAFKALMKLIDCSFLSLYKRALSQKMKFQFFCQLPSFCCINFVSLLTVKTCSCDELTTVTLKWVIICVALASGISSEGRARGFGSETQEQKIAGPECLVTRRVALHRPLHLWHNANRCLLHLAQSSRCFSTLGWLWLISLHFFSLYLLLLDCFSHTRCHA